VATQTGWAIAGRWGLYVGWSQRRVEAIALHASELAAPLQYGDPEVSRFVIGGKLDDAQKLVWKRCQENGDYPVKVKITYKPEPK
jgi:hypothetical protein